MPKTASALRGWAMRPSSEAQRAGDGGDRHGPVERGADRAEDADLLDREGDGRQPGDALVAGQLDELLAGDLHRFIAQPDQAGVGVGDDVPHQGGSGAGLGQLVDLDPHVVGRHAEGGRRGVGGHGGDLLADVGVMQHDIGQLAAAGRVEGHPLEPPAAGGEGEEHGSEEEQGTRQAATHRTESRGFGRRLRPWKRHRSGRPWRGCCGAACAGAAPGVAVEAPSSPAGSTSRTPAARAGSRGGEATRASSWGRWRSAPWSASVLWWSA